ncbi:MAG: hypothetical protein PHU14_12005 [Methylovulum sp.]|nr:hypothetical protein [Methylovulum sp.]
MIPPFIADDADTPDDQNLILSQHLNGVWASVKIVKIERITNLPPEESGWLVTYPE